MPSNIITVQVGQCGNQLGMAFWERICSEHGISPEGQIAKEVKKGEDCKDIFFNEVINFWNKFKKIKFRQIVDPNGYHVLYLLILSLVFWVKSAIVN
jgi:hypothetical protein